MSHWTDNFKSYQSGEAPGKVNREAERGKSDFDLAAIVGDLKDASPDVRRRAVRAITLLGDPRGVPALLKALVDADTKVRTAARAALLAMKLSPAQRAEVTAVLARTPA